ncbi:uncharacterized protein LOC129572816 [Sitodiplosis mosellana]|uniref:uncharacterized protein LOC129572816 n=1 Tax=Sitodiplosis mosellana TaxID=263140 RepID=UPI0024441E40|nr:uncharacterized protein LOC129572816 [Sitodiplosis mosellana]
MQQPQEKRRCSILKKRRSRSLSPKSPQRENTARRASRRISFSGKHNVREFFGNENTAIVWGETYDVSTEKHVLSNEQITLQSIRSNSMSATLQTTRNDSVGMDITSALPSAPANEEKKPVSTARPSILRISYSEDQKENIMMGNDTDIEFSLVMQPPTKPAPSKPLFSVSSFNSSARASCFKPSLFNFARKSESIETMTVGEKTSGSDNMDISGVEPTLQTEELETKSAQFGSKYRDFLQQNNLIAKAKSETNNRRQTVNQSVDMQFDKSQVIELLPAVQPNGLSQKSNTRKTIHEPHKMEVDIDDATKSNVQAEKTAKARRETILRTEDIVESPVPQQSILASKSISQSKKRTTIHESHEMSIDAETKSNNQKKTTNDRQTRRDTILGERAMVESPIPQQSILASTSTKTASTRRDTILDERAMVESPIPKQSILASISTKTASTRRDTILGERAMVESPILQQISATKSILQPSKRATIHDSFQMSFDKNESSNCAQLSDMSIEFLPSELKNQPTRRQTTHKAQDVSLDTPTFGMNPRQMTENLALDMSLDTMHWNNLPVTQPANSKKPTQSSSRMTINELREMSFDSTTKSAAQTYNNKTIFGDISMDLQNTEAFKPSTRKSVICKSPSKNATRLFDRSDAFELTRGADLNSMCISYHPLHSTRLNDGNYSRSTDIDCDTSIQSAKIENNTLHLGSDIDQTFVGGKINEAPVQVPVKQVQIFNQTKQQTIRDSCDLDMSEVSPVPTAKKYNLNKTPFYLGIDKENDPTLIETTHASDLSSLDLTNNSKEETLVSEFKQEPIEARRGTVLFHATIQNDSKLDEANETNTLPIEISDSSIVDPQIAAVAAALDTKRRTCFQEMTISVEPTLKTELNRVSNLMTQSIIQITPIKIDDSIDDNPMPTRVEDNKRLTIVKNESIALNDSPFDYKNTSSGLEESKQLTFIEDDDDEDDQICNTKLDLAISLESLEIDDFVERKHGSVSNKSCSLSKLSLHSDINMPSMRYSAHDFAMKGMDHTLTTEPMPPSLSDTLKADEIQAFKKSSRLRHSNVFEVNNTSAEANQSESVVNEEEEAVAAAAPKHIPMESTKNVAMEPPQHISMAPISRSSIMQRRGSSIGSNCEADETSYLSKSTADKPLSEIKIDFSGYDKLVGLATPQDVFKDFCNRMDQIKRKAKQWEEERDKFERGEIESIDLNFDNNNNDDDLVSQNVEAPSWKFLYMNKMKWEDEEQEAEIDRMWEQRVVGAYLPTIPDIFILTLNKCRMLKNWTFDDIWFFQGNIHLRNNLMHVFKVCLIYDPNTTENSVEMYGALKFTKINRQFCPKHMSQRTYAPFLLEVQELNSKLPSNLLPLCETSAYLSEFDDKMNEYCVKAQNKVKEIHQICRKVNALIKEENGLIYIMKTMLDFKTESYQDYIIELSDIDSTEWRNVRTNPRRVLNEEIKSLPKGVAFIKELLTNDRKYVPWK